ncbi:hypoxanthine-guanine phosphoribosyltransferase [uncultured Lamprocystis sp.]|jgi:hypoxanthine phosphoribosyltransferase|uniref:hypoxanthine-guanine phosphoribosyltransferase n=1 Tax=uncultured Lamprocystis sp. TaxID=543132 RepID=UPI0025F16B21|nr:hypoxanthine-guanine phosphoribosyltransferase [uncultured Lamprocystis sp.]
MKLSPETYTAVADRAECLITQDAMEQAIDRMAEAISERLAGTDPLVLCVMSGGVIATGLLLPRLNFQLRLGHVHVGRYRGATSGGELVWHYRPTEAIRGEQVLIVDDILDEGVTLEAIVRACRDDGAAGIHVAVLVEKRRPHVCEADFVGVQVPDRYLFGYGLDYKNYFRNVPGVFAVAVEDC